ncbi:MAG: transglutaminase domain-containing protein, partial [Deltaproteobacteria bacterium]|nr:transglutaminase domain-containing protein [Deltaproteobacteria bacterium]
GEVVYLVSTEPVASAEYVLVAPQDKPLYVAATALPGLERTVREAAGRRVYRFAARDVPALRPEPRMPPLAELAAQVHASTFPNWEAVGKWYWGLVHDRLDVDDVLRRRVRELTADLGDERAKIEAVFRYAASRTRYVALELGIESIRPRRAALTLARGWGDCKDKAALIVAMLRELGIEAELVLVRTGLRGQLDTSIASLAPFDHAVAYVPSLDLYLDATAEASGAMELPALDRAAVGLRITGGAGRLVRLPDPPAESSAESRRFELTLLDGGALAFRAELRAQGVSAPAWRERFQAEATRRERIGAALASLLGPVELAPGTRGVRAGDLELADRPATMQLEGRAEARAESGSYRVPVGPSYGLTAQYASLARRERPVVLGAAQSRADVWTLRLRPGQRVLSTPEPKQVEASFGSFALAVDAAPDRVTVSTTLTLRRSRIQPGEYDEWRAFCEAVDGAAGPRVVVGE